MHRTTHEAPARPRSSKPSGHALALSLMIATPLLGYALVSSVPGAVVAQDPAAGAPELSALLERIHADCLPIEDGATADYIPALAAADPDRFGIAIATVDGELFTAGDTKIPFALMSAAKPFTAALLLQQIGSEALLEKIGVEPTGEPFNSVIAIERNPQRAINPMVNAGAIAAVSLLQPVEVEARWKRLLAFYSTLAGSELALLDEVLESVSESNYRNRAIANLLYGYDRLYCPPHEALEVYNRQSCVAVTTEQLAWMGASLANGGVHPISGERAFDAQYADEVLSLMTTCGLYDESGAWAYRVGLPSKSGVGGGIVAVVPGRMAIAAYSPRLNSSGNSVRASAAIAVIAKELELSLFRTPPSNE